MKRIGIFVFFDEQGIVDSYKLYFLKELRSNLDELHIIVNGTLTEDGKRKLSEFGDITQRSNAGLDITAYKETILRLGKAKLEEFDELVLCNDTVFGPVYPFQNMFSEMTGRNVDFWGITMGYGDKTRLGKENITYKDHIHSYFMVVGKSLLSDSKFYNYWENLLEIKTYYDAVFGFEVKFTETMSKFGYKYDVLVDTNDIRHITPNPLAFMGRELLENRNCPIFKRRYFYNNLRDFANLSISNAIKDVYDYVDTKTEFDVNLIWDTILRNGELYNIWKQLCLTYILPEKYTIPQNSTNERTTKKQTVCAAIHIYRPEMLDFMITKIKNLPEYVDIIITTNTQEKATLFSESVKANCHNNVETIVVENRGRGESALLVGISDKVMKYDICCLLHDKDSPAEGASTPLVTEGFSYKMYECLIKSSAYVENILQTFANNSRLGVLVAPEPNHSLYDSAFADLWTVPSNFENTQTVLDQIGCNKRITLKVPPLFAVGGMFWFKTEALAKLLEHNWKYDDFPNEPIKTDGTLLHAIERSYTYVAQEAGYYTGFTMPSEFAALEYGNIKNSLLNFYAITRKEVMRSQKLGINPLETCLEILFETADSDPAYLKNTFSYRIGKAITTPVSYILRKIERQKRKLKAKHA